MTFKCIILIVLVVISEEWTNIIAFQIQISIPVIYQFSSFYIQLKSHALRRVSLSYKELLSEIFKTQSLRFKLRFKNRRLFFFTIAHT